jgi:hypothetical protein
MPVLSDTSSYEGLKSHLIELNNYFDRNRDQGELIFPKFSELCPIYFGMCWEKRTARAERFHQIIEELPETNSPNYTFLNSIILNEDSSQMAFSKPLSAVFQGVTEQSSLFQTDADAVAETQFLDSIKDHPETQIERPSIMEATTSFPISGNRNPVYVYSKEGRFKSSITSFNYKSGECGSFYYYELDDISNKPESEKILMASSMELELEYIQDSELDQILFDAFPDICNDCPSSRRFQKVFARLKGYENFYFTYTKDPGKELDDTHVPHRSLIYFDGDLMHTVWSTTIDLFGCSCL